MDPTQIDFTGLSLTATLALAVILAAIDTAWNILLALAHGNFSAKFLPDFLVTHVAKIVAPIAFLTVLGHGIPAFEIPAIPTVNQFATLALGAYFIATVASLYAATKDTSPSPG